MPGENGESMLANEVQHLGTNTLRVFHPLKERVESPCGECRRDDVWDETLVAIRILIHRHVPDERTDERHRQSQSNLPVIERFYLVLRHAMPDNNQQGGRESLR